VVQGAVRGALRIASSAYTETTTIARWEQERAQSLLARSRLYGETV